MKKRGISPIVATVVLISIVIIISVFLWFWYNQFIGEEREKTSINLAQQCIQNTEIQIRSSNCANSPTNYTIEFDLSNTGTTSITEVSFNVKSESFSVNKDIGRLIKAGTSLSMAVLVEKSEIGNEEIIEVQVIPAISKGTELKYCTEKSETIFPSC